MARTPDGIERRKAQDRERKRRKYESDDGFRSKEIERRKSYYHKTKSKDVSEQAKH